MHTYLHNYIHTRIHPETHIYILCLRRDPRGIPSTGVDQDQVEGTLEAHGMHPTRETQRIRTPIGGRVARSAGEGQGRRTLFLLGGLIPNARVLVTSTSVRCVRTLRGMPFTRVRRTRRELRTMYRVRPTRLPGSMPVPAYEPHPPSGPGERTLKQQGRAH